MNKFIEELELSAITSLDIKERNKIHNSNKKAFFYLEARLIEKNPDIPKCEKPGCKSLASNQYGLSMNNKVWLCEKHLKKCIEKEEEIEDFDWILLDQIPYSENSCEVIGCNDYGDNLYGFSVDWKVRLCKKHLVKVVDNNLEDLESLHNHNKRKKAWFQTYPIIEPKRKVRQRVVCEINKNIEEEVIF